MTNINIIGTGGVGSWLAELLARENITNHMTLTDYDTVEVKNLDRQNFTYADVGKPKVTALKRKLEQINKDLIIETSQEKITNKEQLGRIGSRINDLWVVVTDNTKSKKLIAESVRYIIFGGCDRNYYEIRHQLTSAEKKEQVWGANAGYNTTQNMNSNIIMSLHLKELVKQFLAGAYNNEEVRHNINWIEQGSYTNTGGVQNE